MEKYKYKITLFLFFFLMTAIPGLQAEISDARLATLENKFNYKKEDGIKELLKALKSTDREYRKGALSVASAYADADVYIRVYKTIQKAKPEVKIDILSWIAEESRESVKNNLLKELEVRFDLPGRDVLYNQLTDKSTEVRQAAIGALAGISDPKTISALTRLLTDPDERIIQTAKEGLMRFDGDINTPVARVLSAASDAGKIAGLEILAARRATANAHTVFELLRTGSEDVSTQAHHTLKYVVTFNDFTQICGLLETAENTFVTPLQEALIVSLSSQSPAERENLLKRRLLQAGESKKTLYAPIFAEFAIR